MSNLSKKQFPWTKHYDEQSGITWHIHKDSGHKVYNTLTGKHRWQIVGGSHHGELHTSLGDAKKVVEVAHEEIK
jgi:hypothetical protein